MRNPKHNGRHFLAVDFQFHDSARVRDFGDSLESGEISADLLLGSLARLRVFQRRHFESSMCACGLARLLDQRGLCLAAFISEARQFLDKILARFSARSLGDVFKDFRWGHSAPLRLHRNLF